MTAEEQQLSDTKNRRIRRVKRWLRPLPRRANLHRYPVLSWFAASARKRSYLWSFRVPQAIPALYAGCILSLLPIYGIQLPLAFVFALALRANLPILAGLQMISNPFTVLPIWFSLYQMGRQALGLIGIEARPLRKAEVRELLDIFNTGDWGSQMDRILSVFGITSLGAVIIGTFFGVLSALLYRGLAQRTARSYARLQQTIETHRQRKAVEPQNPDA